MGRHTDLIMRTARRLLFDRQMTFRRFANMLVIRIQEKLRCEKILAYPETLIIEPTNACDATCRLCPVGQGRTARPVSHLKMDIYRHFIDELAPYAQRIHFHNWGEPLLDRHLAERIRYASEKGLTTCFSTTLYHLDESKAKEIVASGLDELWVSLHAVSQQSFEAYQPGRSIERVKKNIRLLTAARQNGGNGKPLICALFVRTKSNDHETRLFPELARKLGCDRHRIDDVSLNLRFLWADKKMRKLDLSEDEFLDQARRLATKWLPDDRLATFDMSIPVAKKMRSCDRLWRIGLINSDGEIPPCCDVYHPRNNFGRYSTDTRFTDIWNNHKFRSARRSFKKKKGPVPLVCDRCPGHTTPQNKARNPILF